MVAVVASLGVAFSATAASIGSAVAVLYSHLAYYKHEIAKFSGVSSENWQNAQRFAMGAQNTREFSRLQWLFQQISKFLKNASFFASYDDWFCDFHSAKLTKF